MDPAWAAAAPLLPLLAPVTVLYPILSLHGAIYAAKGRTDLQFKLASLFAGLTLLALGAGLPWGLRGVCAAYTAASLALAVPNILVTYSLMDRISAPPTENLPSVGGQIAAALPCGEGRGSVGGGPELRKILDYA